MINYFAPRHQLKLLENDAFQKKKVFLNAYSFLPFSQTFFRTVVHKFCIPATYLVKYVSLSI